MSKLTAQTIARALRNADIVLYNHAPIRVTGCAAENDTLTLYYTTHVERCTLVLDPSAMSTARRIHYEGALLIGIAPGLMVITDDGTVHRFTLLQFSPIHLHENAANPTHPLPWQPDPHAPDWIMDARGKLACIAGTREAGEAILRRMGVQAIDAAHAIPRDLPVAPEEPTPDDGDPFAQR